MARRRVHLLAATSKHRMKVPPDMLASFRDQPCPGGDLTILPSTESTACWTWRTTLTAAAASEQGQYRQMQYRVVDQMASISE